MNKREIDLEQALKSIWNLTRYNDHLDAANHIAHMALNATYDPPEQQETTITITQLAKINAALVHTGVYLNTLHTAVRIAEKEFGTSPNKAELERAQSAYNAAMAVLTDLDKKLDAGS